LLRFARNDEIGVYAPGTQVGTLRFAHPTVPSRRELLDQMSTIQTSLPARVAATGEPSAWMRLKTNRNFVALWFMVPAAAFLILFLAYPLGLGVWMSFTDEKIGRSGVFIGLENYEWLWDD